MHPVHSSQDNRSGRSAAGIARLAAAYPVFCVLAASLVIAASARIDVPMVPVYMTMQSFAVCVCGALLGPRLGAAAVLVYLGQGLVGFPVFQGGGAGAAHLFGPTGGYLLGFVAAAWTVGMLTAGAAKPGLARLAAVMLAGHAVLFLPGIVWLSTFVGLEQAVTVGLVPFLLGSLVKSALGAATVRLAGGRGQAMPM